MIISSVNQSFYPCLLGPRHGYPVRSHPPPPYFGCEGPNGEPCFYKRERFMDDDGSVYTFYCYYLSTDEQQALAAKDYVKRAKKDKHIHEHEADVDVGEFVLDSEKQKWNKIVKNRPDGPQQAGRLLLPGEQV